MEAHQRIDGYSGIFWNVDFLVDSSLIVEASIQRRLETKINSTFIRIQDIVTKHAELKGALVVDKLHVLFHHSIGKKYFPTSEYRTFIAFGFPILTFEDLPKLVPFKQGALSAFQAASRPSGFYTRSVLSNRREVGMKIVSLLRGGPLKPREMSKALGCKRDIIIDAIRLFPEVKKVGTVYGLDTDSIYKRLLENRTSGEKQNARINGWLDSKILDALHQRGVTRTATIASSLGVTTNSLAKRIHYLSQTGTILRVAKGTWGLPDIQSRLGS